jgi:hypothetical protein
VSIKSNPSTSIHRAAISLDVPRRNADVVLYATVPVYPISCTRKRETFGSASSAFRIQRESRWRTAT